MTLEEDIAALRERAELLQAAYDAAPSEARKAVALVVYRCRNVDRCELLRVWRSPMGYLVRLPPYKLSDSRNATTAEKARARNTKDGVNHWKPRVLVLDEYREWGPGVGFDLNCDHMTGVVIPAPDLLAEADAATPGKPLERRYPR